MEKAKGKRPCPVCEKLVKVSPYGYIPPHNSAIWRLNGKTCSASGKYMNQYRNELEEGKAT